MSRVGIGLESALQSPNPAWRTARVGLLTNHSGINPSFESTIDLIHGHPDINLVALYGPEHGVRGGAQAGDQVGDETDERTGLPVFSLFGASHTPSPEVLSHIDVMLVDMQDIGVRYTTYISCLAEVQTACEPHDIQIVVLDRPNPLGGTTVEGNLLEPAFRSYVGIHEITSVFGLTIGEFGKLWARDNNLRQPEVVPMTDWSRDSYYDETGLPWVLPSPNLPTLESVLAFQATCMFEGTVLSEGRGTTKPFELFGAPFIDADDLAAACNDLGAPGVAFRAAHFIPSFSKQEGQLCHGVQLHITDRRAMKGVALGPRLLQTVKRLYPESFAWVKPFSDRQFIDLLAGTDRLRTLIDADTPVDEMLGDWEADAAAFSESRRDILIYS